LIERRRGERRGRGRPREVENPVRVDIRIPATDYDRLYAIAKQDELSIPALIRKAISALKYTPMATTAAQ
jgi:hypothetical protein